MNEATPAPAACFHVLVVDDCAVDRRIVEKTLKSALFKVTTVDSGKKALEILGATGENGADQPREKDNQINVILTDYCMPEMTGYDLLKVVKENRHLKSIPVVIMSSENDPQRIDRCLSEGADNFILKPLKQAHVDNLRSYTSPTPTMEKPSKKRKIAPDILPENEPERRPQPAGVVVA